MKTLIKKFILKISNWIYLWIWFILTLWVFGLVYAALTWAPQTPVWTWSWLTVSIWNDMLNNVNYLKNGLDTVNTKFWTLTSWKICTSDWSKIDCITEPEFDKTPIFSTTARTTNYVATTTAAWQWMWTYITFTVPPGPNRKYRITNSVMWYSSTSSDYIYSYISTSKTSIIWSPTWMWGIYEYLSDAGRHTAYQEWYLDLAPGTYTYYVLVYWGTNYMTTYHYGTTNTNIVVRPLN